jgi:hypothetical protein
VLVKANEGDITELPERLRDEADEINFHQDNIAAGMVVSTSDGNAVVDQSMARRRQRYEHDLRLLAQEILWPEIHQVSC